MKYFTIIALILSLILVGCGTETETAEADATAANAAETTEEPGEEAEAEAEKIEVGEEFKLAENEYHQVVAVIWHEGHEAGDVEVIKANAAEAVSAATPLLEAAEDEENMQLVIAVNNVVTTARALKAVVEDGEEDAKIMEVAERYHDAYHELKGMIK